MAMQPSVLRKRVFIALFVTAVAVCTLLFIVFSPGQKSASVLPECPGCNIVVIAVDTLRADHLPFYGYDRDTAPFLSSLAGKSVVFERAFSGSSWTAPAVASYFTSLQPTRHGVITGFSAVKRLQRNNPSISLNRIPADIVTLPEYLRDLGFTTIGVSDNLNIGKEIGFDRGFDLFKTFRNEGSLRINQSAREFLKSTEPGKPYFLYLHYMEPHEPYLKHEPWFSECIEVRAKERLRGTKCAYDSEIRFLDGQIEGMFREYRWLENSIVIFLSDHGEEFGDHGKQGHGTSLYTELIRVPFTIYHPAWKAARITENVHTIDLLPTIAALAGQKQNPQWDGVDLTPVVHGKSLPQSRPLISERLHRYSRKQVWSKRSVVVDNLHLIRTDTLKQGETAHQEKHELYDLDTDFREMNDLAESSEHPVEEISGLLREQSPINPQRKSETITIEADTQMLDELRSLGYLN